MKPLGHPWRVLALLLAFSLPSASCKSFVRVFAPQEPLQQQPSGALDEPSPAHTGGLAVLSSGAQEPSSGGLLNMHGNLAAGALATGVGAAVVGAAVVKTVSACSQPGASLVCLRGPSVADSAGDAGAPDASELKGPAP